MYLLDTNVVSEFRRARPNLNVLRWIASVDPRSLMLSVLVIGELRRGVQRLAAVSSRRADDIDCWLDRLLDEHGASIVPFSFADALVWGRISARDRRVLLDTLIAAQALSRNWTVVTRNVRDFERTGARVLNPFEPSEPVEPYDAEPGDGPDAAAAWTAPGPAARPPAEASAADIPGARSARPTDAEPANE